jgi:type I restriction enzyme S subunit
VSSTLAPIMAGSSRKFVPFGRVVDRSREDNRPDLESLSVFLGQGVVPRSSREDNHNRLGADLTKYLVVRPGDLVFNKLRTWQGGFGRSRHEGIVSPAYFVCRPSPGVDARYLHFVLLSSPYLAELTRLSKFMPPSQFDIMWDDLKHLPVPVPDLETQRSVADYLDTETSRIDALIEKKRRMVELLVERDIGLAHEVIVGAPIGGERVKSCLPWLGDLPNGWSLAPVASQFHVTLGRMLNAERAVRGDMRPYGKTSMCVGTR